MFERIVLDLERVVRLGTVEGCLFSNNNQLIMECAGGAEFLSKCDDDGVDRKRLPDLFSDQFD